MAQRWIKRALLASAISASLLSVAVHPAAGAREASLAAGRLQAEPAVSFAEGQVAWFLPGPRQLRRAWLRSAQPCLAVGSDAQAPTRICLVARTRLQVTRTDGTTFRAPAHTGAVRGGLRVRMRQADVALVPGAASATTSCRRDRCPPAAQQVIVPRLRLASCRARAPWLVHEGAPEAGRAVALTFDDGPGALTRRVLGILRAHQAPATFFALGTMVRRDPDVIPRVVADGHSLGNHSYSHPLLNGADSRELLRTNRALVRAGAPQPCLFRAPYGENPPAVVRMARDLGLLTVHWNTDPGDWRSLTADQVVATTLAQARPGSIMVFHDGATRRTMTRALPRILVALASRGYRFLTVPELLGLPVTYR